MGRTAPTYSDGLRLERRDEYPHAVDDVVNFNESVYANGVERGERIGGWMRLGNRVNEGYAELSVCLYLPDGRVACQFGGRDRAQRRRSRPAACATRSTSRSSALRDDLRRRAAGARRSRGSCATRRRLFETAPRADGRVRCDVRGDLARSTAASRPRPRQEKRMYYGPQFSRGHFNQHTAVARRDPGRRRGAGRSTRFGWRDHSWGPRYWQAIWAYRLFIANFGRRPRLHAAQEHARRTARSRRLGRAAGRRRLRGGHRPRRRHRVVRRARTRSGATIGVRTADAHGGDRGPRADHGAAAQPPPHETAASCSSPASPRASPSTPGTAATATG